MIITDEKEIFSRTIHVDRIRAWASNKNISDRVFRADFISEDEKSGCDEKCNEKIRGIEWNEGLYLYVCFIFHIRENV